MKEILAELKEQHRMREDFHREEKSLTLRIKAIERRLNGHHGRETQTTTAPDDNDGGDHCPPGIHERNVAAAAARPLIVARRYIKGFRMVHEKRMRELARQLPIWSWVEQIRGFGDLALAQVIAECGDLCNYLNPAKVWKRMGVAVFDGRAQRKVREKAEAVRQGYSPARRSILWNIGECLVKLNQDGEYRQLYLARKEYEAARPACDVCAKKNGNERCTKAHINNRAKRYMEKRLVHDLWEEWNRIHGGQAGPDTQHWRAADE